MNAMKSTTVTTAERMRAFRVENGAERLESWPTIDRAVLERALRHFAANGDGDQFERGVAVELIEAIERANKLAR